MDDTGGLTCYKCFNLVLRSSNVLQIHTAGLDKCYTTEDRAVADCPSDIMIRERRAREIMLYRKFFFSFSFFYYHYFFIVSRNQIFFKLFRNKYFSRSPLSKSQTDKNTKVRVVFKNLRAWVQIFNKQFANIVLLFRPVGANKFTNFPNIRPTYLAL